MVRVVVCGKCGKEFTAQRSTARYCSASCRAAAAKLRVKQAEDGSLYAQASGVARVVAIGSRGSGKASGRRSAVARKAAATTGQRGRGAAAKPGPIEAQLITELGDAAETSLGLQALALARRMDDAGTTASAMYSLSRQLVVLTAAALRDQVPDVEVDPVAAVQAQVVQLRREAASRVARDA